MGHPLSILESPVPAQVTPLAIQLPKASWEVAIDGSSAWIPVSPKRDLDVVLGSRLWAGPFLPPVVIWRVNQHMEAPYLSPSFSLSP